MFGTSPAPQPESAGTLDVWFLLSKNILSSTVLEEGEQKKRADFSLVCAVTPWVYTSVPWAAPSRSAVSELGFSSLGG